MPYNPNDPYDDYNDALGETDYSAGDLPEHDSPFGSGQRYGFSNTRTGDERKDTENFQKSWNGAGNRTAHASSIGKLGGKADGNSRNSGFYKGGPSGGRFSRNSKSKLPLSAAAIKTKIRNRIIGGVLASALGLGGLGIGFAGPSLLAGKILDVIEKRFMAPTSKAISDHTKNLWKCKLSASCSKAVDEKTGDTGEDGKGMGQISDEAKASLEANNSKVTEPSGGKDGNIELANGDKVGTGADGTADIDHMSAPTENEFTSASPATNETYGANAGDPTADMLKETGANKNVPLEDDVGKEQTIDDQLKSQKAGESDPSDLTTQVAETVQPDSPPDFVKGASENNSQNEEPTTNKAGFTEPTGGSENVEPAKSIKERANEQLDKIPESLKKVGTAATAFVGLACGTSSIDRGIILGIKLAKILALGKFAYTFMTTLNSVMAADGSGQKGHTGPTAEQFSQLMNSLTTVMKDKNGNVTTKSGTDSFGYQAAAGYLSPKGGSKFDLNNTDNVAAAGTPTKFTSSVSVDGQAGKSNSWFDALNSSGIPGSKTLSALLKGGCSYAMDALNIAQAGGLIADGLSLTNPAGWAGLGLQGLGFIGSFLSGGNQTAAEVFADMQAAGACVDAVATASVGFGGCVMGVLSAIVTIAAPVLTDNVINKFKSNFLANPMPVGSDAMDAVISGAGATQGMNASGNGVPVMSSTSTTQGLTNYLQTQKELTAYNQQQDAVKRVGASPFDIYNQATFAGSIMGNFAAALYANGNTPSEMLGSLFGMISSGFANFANGTSAMADAASDAYASSCSDSDFQSVAKGGNGLAADPFCNPIYGLSNSDTMGVEETMNAITQWKDDSGKSAIDSTASNYDETYGLNRDAVIPGAGGLGEAKIDSFINECVSRNSSGGSEQFTPMGSTSESQKDSGVNCAFGNKGKYGSGQNLKVLYNYIQYYLANNNINQGSNLGCQADGSCENGDSSSSNSSSTSTPNGGISFTDSDSVDTNKQTTWDTDGLATNLYGDQNHQDETSFTNGGQPLNADEINYIALNPGWASANGLKLGDVAALTYNGKTIFAVYGDNHAGDTPHAEISARASMNLSGQSTPTNLTGVKFNIYPNTASKLGTSFTQDDINRVGKAASGS